ncbi:hypothetical protein C3432_11820 [Citrobacter amalonaticus]|uniref:Uncharacterized protein n=1 Tax=Citrobacter amalonaticus TaxID=35703 RepID=A0A2S4RRC3_CITAM|nr:hypothetical protein [Citrobacter amalonaticus]POT58563.1 hypothetical protein C3432_11820 [Citrobacter amalonaticus]POT70301.1 hypothetical protein C3436_24520 [Citrobacter amalonaticus]POU61285.1 hypothetical protein C3430_23430 [Citrobacter amalonaticus]POV05146.1 hypothetical protein C3424_07300 [Citrobacter amalonaticus]
METDKELEERVKKESKKSEPYFIAAVLSQITGYIIYQYSHIYILTLLAIPLFMVAIYSSVFLVCHDIKNEPDEVKVKKINKNDALLLKIDGVGLYFTTIVMIGYDVIAIFKVILQGVL